MAKKAKTAAEKKLDAVLAKLELIRDAANSGRAEDAIDRELRRPGRTTAVKPVAELPEVARFREELANGMIRVDAAHQLLGLVDRVLNMILAVPK